MTLDPRFRGSDDIQIISLMRHIREIHIIKKTPVIPAKGGDPVSLDNSLMKPLLSAVDKPHLRGVINGILSYRPEATKSPGAI
jgi:hypothetical protein